LSEKIFQEGIEYLHERLSKLPDKRTGKNKHIKIRDIGLSAFAVFFTQSSSFLEHQKLLNKRTGKSNAGSLFKIDDIPSDNHIRDILDEVPPSAVFPIYDYLLSRASKNKELMSYKHLDNKMLLALDGVHYFSSKKIHCDKCNQKHHRDGTITYIHSMVSATLVHPNKKQVLPLPPEFIEPQDGHEKQDCEINAAKRWMLIHGKKYAQLGIIVLGDDIYCHQPFCESVTEEGFDFIFVCKPQSHKTLYEDINGLSQIGAIKTKEMKRNRETWSCRYINQLEIKDAKKALKINWCELTVFDKGNKVIYHNTFVTNKVITEQNIFEIVEAGRTRWKTENELNNTLKNHGYYLEHNFGHGKNHLASFLVTLMLLSFLFHSLLHLLDNRYRAIRNYFSRKMFFQQLRTLLFYMYFVTWDTLMEFMVNAGEFELDSS
jgi:hypothetical protein